MAGGKADSVRTILYALGANLAIAAAKTAAAVFTGSSSMLAEAIHAGEMVAAINRAEKATRAEFPEIQWLFFEPDVAD